MKKLKYILFTTIIVFMVSCSDDDTFSTSMSNKLTMDIDSVKFDTVFTKIPTAAKYFWVRNNSGDGIRCSAIRLERGNQSGFRVNVDGVYLGQESGFKTTDVEIRKGDSIRVFVELTAPSNNEDGPRWREDNIVFTLESGAEQTVNLNAWTWDADTVHTLKVTSDMQLETSLRPLIVYEKIIVDTAATLTIPQGTTIYFKDEAGIDVYGRLLCKGTSEANITLRGYRLDNMFDYLPYDLTPGHWKGVRFYGSSFGNQIEYTDIHSTYDGVVCDSSNVSSQKLYLHSSTIHNCQGYGLYSAMCKVNVEDCQITNTLKDCVAIYGGEAYFKQCTIAQFYPFDSNRGHALYFANSRDGYDMPLYGISVVNSIITGYADDVILGTSTEKEDVDYLYYFAYSILKTPSVTNPELIDHVIWERKDTEVNSEKHFKNIDTDKLRYDFRLDSISPAIGSADPLRATERDRDGKPRDSEHPNMGCY